MADTNEQGPKESKTAKTNDNTAMEAMEKQVAQLRREITGLKRSLSERAEEVAEEAEGWFDSASDKAARTTQALKTRAQTVSSTVRDNPGTVSSAMLLGGVFGLFIGLALSHVAPSERWYDRYR